MKSSRLSTSSSSLSSTRASRLVILTPARACNAGGSTHHIPLQEGVVPFSRGLKTMPEGLPGRRLLTVMLLCRQNKTSVSFKSLALLAVLCLTLISCSDDLERIEPEPPSSTPQPETTAQTAPTTPQIPTQHTSDWFQQRVRESVERTRAMSSGKLDSPPSPLASPPTTTDAQHDPNQPLDIRVIPPNP